MFTIHNDIGLINSRQTLMEGCENFLFKSRYCFLLSIPNLYAYLFINFVCEEYMLKLFSANKNNPHCLIKLLSQTLPYPPPPLPDDFSNYIITQIDALEHLS